jgi:nuclear pore complex protein Nup133
MFATPGASPLQTSLLNVSSRRSLHTSSRATPSVANRSQRAGQAIKETAHHVVKALNSPVPVQVQETLRGDLSSVSVRLHESGWAWLVCGRSRRLLLWRYGPKETAARCFQLSLPLHSSEWNADLIVVCGKLSSTCVGVLAVSGDGHIYYWDNALRERSAPSSDGTVDVGSGHVIVSRPVLQDSRAVLLTSKGSLLLIQPPSNSQGSLSARTLHTPQGILSGFGRRVSSLFFGSAGGGDQSSVEGRSIAVLHSHSGTSCHLFVLVSSSLQLLQKWVIEDRREQMVYELSLEPVIGAPVIQRDWFKGQQVSLKVWAVDVAVAQEHVVVLFAVGVEGSSVAEFGLALFNADCDSPPNAPESLIQLNHKISHQGGEVSSIYSVSLHSSQSSPSVAVHNKNTLLLNILSADDATTDVVGFPPSTSILGKGVLEGHVVLFSTVHGVISIHLTLTSPLPPSSTSQPSSQSHTSVTAPLVVASSLPSSSSSSSSQRSLPPEVVAEAVETLKDAFLQYLEGNITEASVSSHQLFSSDTYATGGGDVLGPGCDGLGDLAVKTLSEMVLNDQPAHDPRWGDNRECLTGGSVVILYQLESKQTAHVRLMQFIGDCGLLKKLSCVTVRGQPMRTTHLLCEHTEKIVAAIALRKAHNQVVDQGMKLCVDQRSGHLLLRPGLSHQDLFYTEVVQLDSLFPPLLSLLTSRLASVSHPKERLQLVLSAGVAVESMLREAVQYRQSKSHLYSPSVPPDPTSLPPFSPWTASSGSTGVRACLCQLLEMLYEAAVRDADTQQEIGEVWEVSVGLCDVLLGGYLDQMLSMEQNPALSGELVQVRKQFETSRKRFLSPLLEHGQFDQSIELAEKYHDFHLLVHLCESAGDRDRLKTYIVRFSEQGFAEFLFKRHLDQGNIEELLSYSKDFPEQLAKFLEPHDNIGWLHHVAAQDYHMAHETLQRLAQKEDKFVGRKKTQLSLSKLALLASGPEDEEGDTGRLNRELGIIEYQRNIPDCVLEELGILDMETMLPLSPGEIVELYVGERNRHASEADFLNALDLLQIAYEDRQSEGFTELKTYIWSQAALRDDWSQMSTDDPLGQIPHTLFFKVVLAAFCKGCDLGCVLPSVEELLSSPSLLEAGVAQGTHFRFLLTAGFEQLERLQSSEMA